MTPSAIDVPVFVVFWRKHVGSGKSFRKYVTNLGSTGFTEDWKHANRYTTKDAAEVVARRVKIPEKMVGRGPFVVEEKRPLPPPKGARGPSMDSLFWRPS